MILYHENGSSLFEKPSSSSHREAYMQGLRSIYAFLVILLVFLTDGCISIELTSANPMLFSPYFFNRKLQQCLILHKDLRRTICSQPVNYLTKERLRSGLLNDHTLKFCNSYNLYTVISNSDRERQIESMKCEKFLWDLESKDCNVSKIYGGFLDLVQHFDCHNSYSVKWNCTECKEAYKRWLCSSEIPYFYKDIQIEPCVDFCLEVETKCPFLRPETLEFQAGEPSFICKDRSRDDSSLSGSQCYKQCHITGDCSFDIHSWATTISNNSENKNNSTIKNSCCGLLYRNQDKLLKCILYLIYMWVVRTVLQLTTLGYT